MQVVAVQQGASPVILAFPHVGTFVPSDMWDRLNENGRKLADTDWHIDQLYAGLLPQATTVRATFHRYVIDANRDPAGTSLYPGQNTTALVPHTDFDGAPIWLPGAEPKDSDVAARLAQFHTPYHAALTAEVARIRALHGVAILYDCHSIRSRIPFLFDGTLPDFNIGTDSGRSCAPVIEAAVASFCENAPGFSTVRNGRFKGGWTTRHYANPQVGVHTLQMELSQLTHLQAEALPFAYDAAKAERLRPHLQRLLQQLEALASTLKT